MVTMATNTGQAMQSEDVHGCVGHLWLRDIPGNVSVGVAYECVVY